MATKEVGKAIGDMLATNSTLRVLDVSANNWDDVKDLRYAVMNPTKGDGTGFAKELAVGLRANGALETITFGDEQAATMKSDMTEADLSGKELGASGATIVAAFLPKCQ